MKRYIEVLLPCGILVTAYRAPKHRDWRLYGRGVDATVLADPANIQGIIQLLEELEINTPGNRRKR